jgi:hypothetical protein
MAKEQKTIRTSSEIKLDIEVNKMLLEKWKRSGDARVAIIQTIYNSGTTNNEEVWYQTLVKDKNL